MKKSKLTTIISIFILCVGLISTLILDDGIASRISEIITIITAIIGAVALFFQFKRDKDVNEASFLMDFWKNFSNNPTLINVQKKCNNDTLSNKTSFTEEDYDGILVYAQWLEALCAIINRGVLTFDFVDDMYNYIFFIFVNNKYIQNLELIPYIKYYQGIVKAYATWEAYLKKNNKEILLEENSLLKAIEEYNKKNS